MSADRPSPRMLFIRLGLADKAVRAPSGNGLAKASWAFNFAKDTRRNST